MNNNTAFPQEITGHLHVTGLDSLPSRTLLDETKKRLDRKKHKISGSFLVVRCNFWGVSANGKKIAPTPTQPELALARLDNLVLSAQRLKSEMDKRGQVSC